MHAHARAPVHSFTSLSVHCFLSSPSLSLTWYKESFSSFSHTLYCAALIPFSSSLSIFPFTVSEAVTDIGEKQSIGSSFQHPHAWTRTQTNTAAAWMRTCNNSTLVRGALLWYSRRWAFCVCMIIICPLLMFVYWTEWVCVSVCVCGFVFVFVTECVSFQQWLIGVAQCQDGWARPQTQHHSYGVDLLQISLGVSLLLSVLTPFQKLGSSKFYKINYVCILYMQPFHQARSVIQQNLEEHLMFYKFINFCDICTRQGHGPGNFVHGV